MSLRWPNADGQVVTTQELLREYRNLDQNDTVAADEFFRKFGPGHPTSPTNPSLVIINTIQERLMYYEHILHEICTEDNVKYQQIHKGTIFYLVGWLAYTLKDFEKAVFYEDADLGEDIRAATRIPNPDTWKTAPAADFLLLNTTSAGSASSTAVADLVRRLQQYITAFNGRTGASLTLDLFRNNFLSANIDSASFRSIISGLYVFIMEYTEKTYLIRLRSIGGGSIQPFLVHLFSGCLVLESLLKNRYGAGTGTLGNYLGNATARRDLEIAQGTYTTPVYQRGQHGGYTLQSTISQLPVWQTENYIEKIFAVSYAIRNTAGHDLSWPDQFDEITYQEIYNSIIDAILWFIWKVKI